MKKRNSHHERGAILAELIVAIGVAVVMVTFGAQLASVSLTASESSKERGEGLRLAQEALEAMRAIAYGDDNSTQGWNRVYRPPSGSGDPSSAKGASNPYYPVISTSTPMWILFTGLGTTSIEGQIYSTSVVIENVSRDATTGTIESTYTASRDDPATQKITVTVTKGGTVDTTLTTYLTRFYNESSPQSDWSSAASCSSVGATSTPTVACTLSCITGSTTVGSLKLISNC